MSVIWHRAVCSGSFCTLIIVHNNITARTTARCNVMYEQLHFSVPYIESGKGNMYWVRFISCQSSTTRFSWPRESILPAQSNTIFCSTDLYLLSPSLELTGFHLVKGFPAFYGTQTFFTANTSAHQLSLSWASSIQSIPPQPTSWRYILIVSPIYSNYIL
jgi:hypothetical protein